MAKSIQMVRGQAHIFRDLDLIALVCIMDFVLDGAPAEYRLLQPLVSRWQQDLEGFGPGTIELGLDELLASPERGSQFVQLLGVVEEELQKRGDTVPASLLNQRCRAPGVTFTDYSAEVLRTEVIRITALLGS